MNKIIETNKNVATSAAYMEAGRIANNQISKALSKKLPMLLRGYVDTCYGKLIISNIANIAIEKFRPEDAKLQTLSKAMMVQAYQDVLREFDIESMIEELLENPQIKRATKMLGEQE